MLSDEMLGISSSWAVLGACVIGTDRTVKAEALGMEDRYFEQDAQRCLWRALVEQSSRSGEYDISLLWDSIERQGLARIDALKTVSEAMDHYHQSSKSYDFASFAVDVERRIGLMRAESNRRLVRDAMAASSYAAESGQSADEILADFRSRVAPVEECATRAATWAQTVDAVLQRAESGEEATERVPVNLPTIDATIGGGVGPGWLVIVMGSPGSGKTAFSLQNVVVPLCRQSGGRAFIASLEMTAEQLALRLISAEAGVAMMRIASGQLRAHEWSAVGAAADLVTSWQIVCDDQLQSVAQVCARARAEARAGELDVIVVDYLQLLRNGKDTSQLDIAESMNELRKLGKELQVPVFVLSQSSLEARKAGKPLTNTSGKGAGEIEEAADLMLFLHRPSPENYPQKAHVRAGKNRHGPTKTLDEAEVQFNTRFLRYEEIVA